MAHFGLCFLTFSKVLVASETDPSRGWWQRVVQGLVGTCWWYWSLVFQLFLLGGTSLAVYSSWCRPGSDPYHSPLSGVSDRPSGGRRIFFQRGKPSQDEIKLVPMFWSLVAPGHLMLWLCPQNELSPWKLQNASSLCLFAFILPIPRCPEQEEQDSWSAPPLALRSSRKAICSELGMFLMMDARLS